MLRRKFYPAATKYLLQAIEKWDGDDQDLAQVCNYVPLSCSMLSFYKSPKQISDFQIWKLLPSCQMQYSINYYSIEPTHMTSISF